MATSKSVQKDKAATLLSLHTAGTPLILPNVWNPIGARILQSKGYPAVATASAAISASLGYRDGEKLKRSTMIDIIGRIARCVDVPVTADIESGYGGTTSELEETIRTVIDAGVVGVNIEDGLGGGHELRPVEDQCERVSTVRQAADRLGLHVVINARIDSFLSSSYGSVEEATEDAVSRAAAYSGAGADCVYPIGPGDEETVRELRGRIASPINILGSPARAPLSVLESIGVNRVSYGPFVFRSCLRKFEEITDSMLRQKDHSGIGDMLSKTDTEEYLLDGPE
jgi:2-methylisocitrate lyase-like PEP mutase family enzyme